MGVIMIGEHTLALPVHFFTWHADEIIKVGKFSGFALGVKIFSGGEHFLNNVVNCSLKTLHLYSNESNKDIYTKGPTLIGNDVIIMYNAIVLSGVKIGDGAVVGAGSVVTKDVPPYAIVAGNPTRIIKYRFTPKQVEALLRIRWWDWSFEEIKNLQEYFYMDIDTFISKAFEKMNKEGRL